MSAITGKSLYTIPEEQESHPLPLKEMYAKHRWVLDEILKMGKTMTENPSKRTAEIKRLGQEYDVGYVKRMALETQKAAAINASRAFNLQLIACLR